jgi:hypothetical protein
MKILFVFTVFTFFSISLFAQDLDEVFDDGGLSNIKNGIGISISKLVEGAVCIHYERYLKPNMSLVFNVGPILFDGLPMNLAIVAYDKTHYYQPDKTLNYGFIFDLQYRGYVSESDGWLAAYEIGYRYQDLTDETNSRYHLTYTFGYKYRIQHFAISSSLGLGFMVYGYKNKKDVFPSTSFSGGLYFPLNIDITYEF